MKDKMAACLLIYLLMLRLSSAEDVDITTTSGIIRGTRVSPDVDKYPSHASHSDVNIFHGVPYAEPPVGEKRFKNPEEVKPWDGVKEAKTKPSACWQTLDLMFDRFPGVEMWNPNTPRSEDCLYLNAWIPNTTSKKAIMVWIYGGGFWAGSASLDIYDASKLASINDVIVINVNYRIGPLGFLYTGSEDSPGNMGLMDQVMALKWIKANAENLGGDPDRITIFGESAGGTSVGLLLASPLSRDLFQNAILMSGSPLAWWAIREENSDAFENTIKLAKLLNCPTIDYKEMIDCLKFDVSAENVTDAQWNINTDIYRYFDVKFRPVIEPNFMPKHPKELIEDGWAQNKNVMTGVVKDEGIFWVLYVFTDVFKRRENNPVSKQQYMKILPDLVKSTASTIPTHKLAELVNIQYYLSVPISQRNSFLDIIDDISGDALFKCSIVEFSRLYTKSNLGKVFQYSFEHRDRANPWPSWLGAAHGYEIGIVFGQPFILMENYTDSDREFSKNTMEYFTNFAKNSDPSGVVTWPEYTNEDEEYLVMGQSSFSIQSSLRHRECSFWLEYIPLLEQSLVPVHDCDLNGSSSLFVSFTGFLLIMPLLVFDIL